MSVRSAEWSTSRLSEAPPWVWDIWRRSASSSRGGFRLDADRVESLVTSVDQEGGKAAAFWHVAEWDSRMLGVKCAKVDAAGTVPDRATSRGLLARLFSEVGKRACQEGVKNVFFQIPSDDLDAVQGAEDAGFRRIGDHLDFVKMIHGRKEDRETADPIRPASPEDADTIAGLAELLHTDRFHRDGSFDSERVATLWRTSVRNAVQHWAEAVYVYHTSDGPVGFVVLIRGEGAPGKKTGEAGRIYLIAVAPEFRGCGVGRALINRAVLHFRRTGVSFLRVGTQRNNDAAIARYQSCGFSLERTFCQLSWWLNAQA